MKKVYRSYKGEFLLRPLYPLLQFIVIEARIDGWEGKLSSRGLGFGDLTEKEGVKNSQILSRALQNTSFYHYAVEVLTRCLEFVV